MPSRLGQQFLRAKSKAENFGLIDLYPCFFCIMFGYPMAIWLLSRKQSHPPNFSHCIWAIVLWPKGDGEGLGLYTQRKLKKALSPDLHPVFEKCGNAPNTQNNYRLTLWWPLGLHNTSMDAKFTWQNFSFCW